MIPLRGRGTVANWSALTTDVWRVARPQEGVGAGVAILLTAQSPPLPGAPLYLTSTKGLVGPGPTLQLPAPLSHVAPDDVLIVAADGSQVAVAWKATAAHNSLLLTERCDHFCLMCSQPPKERDDSYLFQRAERIISALPPSAHAVTLSGGEPTVDADAFLRLLRHIEAVIPTLSTHVLSNGRRFSDPTFADAYARIPLDDIMIGIPLYAAEPSLHDYIVQSVGAFNDTVTGILNLADRGAAIELRVVVQKANMTVLPEIATFIARNLPFVNQVALMGLEMTGLARPNSNLVWVDPYDYREQLRQAHRILQIAGVRARIYNHPLCVLHEDLWPAAVQSISDWKNDFPSQCSPCDVKDSCSGVFSTSGTRLSAHLTPVHLTASGLPATAP